MAAIYAKLSMIEATVEAIELVGPFDVIGTPLDKK